MAFAPIDRREEFIDELALARSQLFGFIFSMVHNMQDAEDLFQQTSLSLWNNFNSFEVGTDFVSWACKIARNKAVDFLRAKKRELYCFSEEVLDYLAQQQASSSELHVSRSRALALCLNKLSKSDRSLIDQCYHRKSTIKIIATTVGRSVDSVYVSLTRIRRALFRCVNSVVAQEEQ